MLDYSKLNNIDKIDEDYIFLKDGRKVHTDNFTFVNVFNSQEELENFDKRVLNILFGDPIKVFVAERDFALLSLDKKRILDYIEKYDIPQDEDLTEEEFWAGVHYSILNLRSATEKQKAKSRAWLLVHNYSIH